MQVVQVTFVQAISTGMMEKLATALGIASLSSNMADLVVLGVKEQVQQEVIAIEPMMDES